MATDELLQFRKLTWGDGPWLREPDELNWVDEATQLPCRIIRHNQMGHLCGYVGLPPDHPLYELDYDGEHWLDAMKRHKGFRAELRRAGNLDEMKNLPERDPVPGSAELLWEIQVHGGLTFANRFEEDEIWWIGFDCAHAHDLVPYLDNIRGREKALGFADTYRTIEYVRGECIELARQLFEIKTKATVEWRHDNSR